MFGKLVTISTVKQLSRNYASFQQPSVQEWYSLSTSNQTQNIPNGYPDFHKDGCILQNAGLTKGLRIASVVCGVITLLPRVFKLFLLSLKRKRHFTPYPKMLIYSVHSLVLPLPYEHFWNISHTHYFQLKDL